MAIATDRELVPEAILDQDGLKVSASPWGPDDEIGRLNWITPDTNRAILEHLDGAHLFDLNVEYFIGMPSWVVAGMQGVDCLPEGYAITPKDLQDTAAKQGTDIPPKSVVLVRTGRMTVWPDFD